MQLISIDGSRSVAVSTPEPHEREQAALCGLIASMGKSSFGSEGLAELNRWMPLSWWSVYRLYDDRPPGLMHTSGSYGCHDGTRESWDVYRKKLYRGDRTFDAARESIAVGELGLLHWDARELSGAHRAEIYSRHGLRARLSIVLRDEEHGLLAANFYRHQTQAVFLDEEIDAFRRIAKTLMMCVTRHIELAAVDGKAAFDEFGLTTRERDVCDRLLRGWTYEGIGADLHISAGTVKTYRDRAFERIGIHHRNELFALVSGRLVRCDT